MKQKILIISGPTASGKTKISIHLAKKFNGEIISADSIQVYKGADIGSAKITAEEMCGITHHLIDIKNVNEKFNAGDFARLAEEKIDGISKRRKFPIIVGGTGLYINALLFGFSTIAPHDENIRQALMKIKEENGNLALYKILEEIDPKSAQLIHPNQTDRIIRAIEIFKTTGERKSELEKPIEPKFDYLFIVLDLSREDLYKRIDSRVEEMVKNGIEDEVRSLIINEKLTENSPLLTGIGYKEMFAYINGKISLDDCVNQIKQHSRNYAKRQITWFKKIPGAIFVKPNETDKIDQFVEEFINGKD